MPKDVFYRISKERQSKLLRSSFREFLSKPYEKITVQSLSESMKILRTDFYYYFTDKDDLYNKILEDFKSLVFRENKDANFHEALKILFDKVMDTAKTAKGRQNLIDLTENFHPQFAKNLVPKIREMFQCTCEGDKPQVKVMTKMYRFLTVVNLYAKKELSEESAKEILEN